MPSHSGNLVPIPRSQRMPNLRPFGAPAWLRVGKRSKKGRRRGQRCLLLGYAGDVDKGYRVITLATRKIVTDVDVTASTDLSPVRDFITSMRMDSFFRRDARKLGLEIE